MNATPDLDRLPRHIIRSATRRLTELAARPGVYHAVAKVNGKLEFTLFEAGTDAFAAEQMVNWIARLERLAEFGPIPVCPTHGTPMTLDALRPDGRTHYCPPCHGIG